MAVYTIADEIARKNAAKTPLNNGVVSKPAVSAPAPAPVNPAVAANIAKVTPSVGTVPKVTPTYNEQPQTNYGTGALGQILSAKKQYDAGAANQNQGLETWASSTAAPLYGQLDPKEAALVKGMNTQRLIDYINNKGTGEVKVSGSPVGAPVGAPDPGYTGADVQSEIDAKIKAYQGQQDSAKIAAQFGIDTNKAYLQDQLNGLAKSETVAGDSAQQLQNRRGGLYSGGLDYQMGGIQQSYADSRGGLSRDVASRNQQLLDQYGSQANTIASQIQNLQSSAPGIISDKIAEFKQKQADSARADAELALRSQDQTFNQNMTSQEYADDKIKYGEETAYKKARDKIADEKDKREFDAKAKQQGADAAVSWYNAKTSRQNANTNSNQESRLAAGDSSGSSGGNPKIPAKDSANNSFEIKSDIMSEKLSPAEAFKVLQANADNLSDSDYKVMVTWINGGMK